MTDSTQHCTVPRYLTQLTHRQPINITNSRLHNKHPRNIITELGVLRIANDVRSAAVWGTPATTTTSPSCRILMHCQ